MQDKNKKTAVKLAFIPILMFGFGFALVPLYDVICDVTGLNGKTGTIDTSKAEKLYVDKSRWITVEFDTNVNSNLNWAFSAGVAKLQVRPGEIGGATFNVTNLADEPTYGRAIPSVAPAKGSLYFNKTECFCFSQQRLLPGESMAMTVRFVVDPKLPQSIGTLTLSYTFFPLPDPGPLSITETDPKIPNDS